MKLNVEKDSLLRDVITMVSGTAFAQVISFFLTPLITRAYGPEAYGIMGSFGAIVGIFAPIVALTYPVAIVLPKKERDALGLVKLSFYITVCTTSISLILIIFFKSYIVNIFHLESIRAYLYFIPFTLFSAGILQILEQWLIRKKKFNISAKASVLESLLLQGSKASIGMLYPSASMLVFLLSLKQGLKVVLFVVFSRFNFKSIIKIMFKDKLKVKVLIKRFIDFPLFRAPQTFIDAVTRSIPILLLTSLFSPEVAGYYALSKTTLNVPIDLISKTIGDVIYPRISDAANNKDRLATLLLKSTTLLFGVGIVPFGIIIILGPNIFTLVFGSNWVLAGVYARWVALWSFSSFILQPSLRSLPVLNSQAIHLVFTIISLIFRVLSIVLGSYLFSSDVVAIASFSITSALFNVLLIVFTIYKGVKFDQVNGY